MDLSVIIPVCGAGRHIAACLRSVTRCPGENIDMECIVICAGSADGAPAIVNRYIERDRRIKLVIKEDGNACDVRNTGVERAAGRYILFLDADDRLCEDAWEQIEAAVEEEYADFVAFSYITSRSNGKLKAKMLPLSDMISTDEDEARRLLYAGSALKSCRGKLFKSRIIRDNHISFPSDAPVRKDFSDFSDISDFFFVTEYFEQCESYLMTKAMILYCAPWSAEWMNDRSVDACLDLLWILYDVSMQAAGRCQGAKLQRCVRVYFFETLVRLLCGYMQEYHYNKNAYRTIFENALKHELTKELLGKVNEGRFHSWIRRYEYRLFRSGNAEKIRRYVSVRAKLYGAQDSGIL